MVGMPPAPKHTRRWFQFSLWTMLLAVTAFAVWLGLELSYVRQRKATLRNESVNVIRDDGVYSKHVRELVIEQLVKRADRHAVPISKSGAAWLRVLLGDEEVMAIITYSQDDFAYATPHFPEATIILLMED
jgi:hypothetical protein